MKRIFSGFIALFLLGAPALAAAQVTYQYGYPYGYYDPPYNSYTSPYSYTVYPYSTNMYAYGSACTYILTDVIFGTRGSDVTTLQQFLVNQEYPGTGSWMLTGYFGQATQAALRTFQASRGLPQTGYADAATRAAIMQASCLSGQGGSSYGQYPYNYQYPYQYPYQQYHPYPCTYPYPGYCNQGSAPSISGVTGPTTLPVGNSGTWTLNLQSYGNQYMTTSVQWGDEYLYGYGAASQMNYPNVSTSLTFTHAYSQRGTYTVVFTVRDSQGRQNTATQTVYVY